MLVAIYGRRRIGKTALVEEAFRDDTVWKFEGIESGDTKTQIRLFQKQLSRYTADTRAPTTSDWDDAFRALDRAIDEHTKRHPGRLVVFFDEFQWLCEMKPKLVALFKYHWDNFFVKRPECVFVLCGSVSSFIVSKVVQSQALYGRVDLEIHLRPLSIRECRAFSRETPYAAQSIDTYMVFGGVPQYMMELNPALSLQQNLNEYAFKSSGFFFKEFDRLFISHFAQHPTYERVLRALADQACTPKALAAKCQVEPGGVFSARLRELGLAGFVKATSPIGKPRNTRLIRYSLDDEFLHFYFRFIEPHSAEIVSGNTSFQRAAATPGFEQWRGYAFERLCRKHADLIADYLRFSGISYQAGAWFQRGLAERPGAQVDLLFVRADKAVTVCEMKYADRLSASEVASGIRSKLEALRAAFPRYAVEKVLLLGNAPAGIESVKPHFDRVLNAEEVFLGAG